MLYATQFGFATVGTNNGHFGDTGQYFLDNTEVLEDFAYRAMHTGVVTGKELAIHSSRLDLKDEIRCNHDVDMADIQVPLVRLASTLISLSSSGAKCNTAAAGMALATRGMTTGDGFALGGPVDSTSTDTSEKPGPGRCASCAFECRL